MEETYEPYKPIEKLELRDLKEKRPRDFEHINCPSCDNDIISEDMDLSSSMAKCGACNAIFSIEKDIGKIKRTSGAEQRLLRPEGVELFYYRNELEITTQQPIQGVDLWMISMIPLIAIGTILAYFLRENPIPSYIPILLSIVGVYYIYKGLTYSRNKTYIEINEDFLSIKHRPRNLKKDKSFTVDEIDQLYLKPSADGMGYYTIHVIINGVNGQRREKLITVKSLTKAKYLEQEIERYLDIEDREIA